MQNRECSGSALLLTTLLCATLIGCATAPTVTVEDSVDAVVCDSYIILDMCVQDLVGDGTVDMVYFSDTNEIFMYQEGRKDLVAKEMPFHRCAVVLSAEMQHTTNRILKRSDMSFVEELDITKQLISNYVAAKPSIDACHARFEGEADSIEQEDDFFMEEQDWEQE